RRDDDREAAGRSAAVDDPRDQGRSHCRAAQRHAAGSLGQPLAAVDRLGHPRLLPAARGRPEREVMSATATATVRPSHARASRPAARRTTWMVLAVLALAALCTVSVAVGVRSVSPGDIVAAQSGRSDGLGAAAVTARLPRTVLAVLVGAALALAGT